MNCISNHIEKQKPKLLCTEVLFKLGAFAGGMTVISIHPTVGITPALASSCVGAVAGGYAGYLLDKKIEERYTTKNVPITQQPVASSKIFKAKTE